jgi:hypothetical protein
MIRYVHTTCKLGGATNTSFLALIPKAKKIQTLLIVSIPFIFAMSPTKFSPKL